MSEKQEEFEVLIRGLMLIIKEGNKEINIGYDGWRMRKLKSKIKELEGKRK